MESSDSDHQLFPPELQSEAYEILSSNDNTAVETLFTHLHSPEHRSRAVAFLQCCKHHHPDLLFIKLFYILTSSPDPTTRAHAARTLQFLDPTHLWSKLRLKAQQNLQAHFLQFMAQEPSPIVLRPASLLLAETVTVFHNPHRQWPEILDFLLNSLSLPDDRRREVALSVLASLHNDCRSILSASLRNRPNAIPNLYESIIACLESSSNNIKVLSFRAAVNFVELFSAAEPFHALLRAMMLAMFALLQGGFERSYFRSAFSELASMVSREPILLRPYMCDMVLDALQIAESGIAGGTRRLVIGMVVSMAEAKEYEQVLPSLPDQTVVRLFVVLMRMVVRVEEDGGGGGELGVEGVNVGGDVSEFGIKGLEKICAAVGGGRTVAVVRELLPPFLDAAEWKERHAGIAIFGVIAKLFSDEMVMMENFLPGVVNRVLKLLQDPHVQVRLAAFNLMQMPTNFVQAVQILYVQKFGHAFSVALVHEEESNVKEEAAIAMLFFLKNTLPESLKVYKNVDTVMANLLSLIKGSENHKLRSIALSTFNTIALQCREAPQNYFGDYLKILVDACTDKNAQIKEEGARGIRIYAELGTPKLKPYIHRIISELSMLIKNPNLPVPENAKAHDIAVSAIGRICEFHRDCIDGSTTVPTWLSFLPLKSDLVEAKLMHEQLSLMVSRFDKDLFGFANQNLEKIIKVLIQVIEDGGNIATPETINQMNDLLTQLARNIPQSALDSILVSLSAQQRDLLFPLLLP